MRSHRVLAALLTSTVLLTGCSERTPTEPLSDPTSTASVSGAAPAARSAPRPLAPRVSENDWPIGTWGGSNLNLTIGAAGAVLEFDCAHGSIDQAFAADASGRFDLAGTFVAESPGPIREDPLPSHPARYSGTTDGRTMTLTVTMTDTEQVFGPFRLSFGTAGRVFKCL
jgi:hypothetical protein